jgi:predicted transcriptional regulator
MINPTFNFRVTPEILEQLKKIAKEERRSASAIVLMAVEMYLRTKQPAKKVK